MRPVLRGPSPRSTDYGDYSQAFPDLAARLGPFCSYCERRINAQLAVEHIQPKGLAVYEHLEGCWENFLLGCANCNSTKGKKDVVLADFLLPDRDNTARAYVYSMDGRISVNPQLDSSQRAMAARSLRLTGLDKPINEVYDANGQLVAIDRVAQRLQAWLKAIECEKTLRNAQFRPDVLRLVIAFAAECGFFSIWMEVFANEPSVRQLLIQAFAGTAADCYDPQATHLVCPRPANGLPHGSKV